MNSENMSDDEKQNKIESKIDFNNVKSNFILKKIFDFLRKNKSLNIIKCNKKLQERLNLSINNYEEYFQLYTPIEIELKFDDNKYYSKFINIDDKQKEYYHIYFDNSNKEIKRNYLEESEKVNMIKIIIDYQVKSFEKLFYKCREINSISFKRFDRININDMSYMFDGCSSINELNLSNFNTNNVTNMNEMFSGCSSLKEINLNNFSNKNVIDMCSMFFNCSSLK